jgi:hypothetical protein
MISPGASPLAQVAPTAPSVSLVHFSYTTKRGPRGADDNVTALVMWYEEEA